MTGQQPDQGAFPARNAQGVDILNVGATTWHRSCNSRFGHGVFEAGPDVPWRSPSSGHAVPEYPVAACTPPGTLTPTPDPAGRKRGGKMALEGPHMVPYCCRKRLEPVEYSSPIQDHHV